MNRKTLVAGLIFAGLILVTVLLLKTPEKGTRPAGMVVGPVAKIAPNEVDVLEVTKSGVTTVLKKSGDQYSIVKPVTYTADKQSAAAAFEAVEKLEWDSIVSTNKDRQTEFELGADSLRLVAKKGEQTLFDLRVGKTNNLRTLVRLEGKDEVWSVGGIMKYMVDKTTSDWRDKSITTFAAKDAEKLTVTTKDGAKIILAKPTAGDAGPAPEWRVLESSVKVDKFDKNTATGMISQLENWKANDFADSAKLEETGLEKPEFTVAVELTGGKTLTAMLGNKKGEDETYVKLADQPQIFLVKKWNLDRINKRPIEFRDKTFCDLTAAEIVEVTVNRGKDSYTLKKSGEEFKLIKPTGLTLDTSKVAGITGAFTDWKAQSFAEGVKDTGLAKPGTVIVAESSTKGRSCQIKVGNETSEKGTFYVQTVGQPDIMLVPKWSLDRVLVNVEDLKKKP